MINSFSFQHCKETLTGSIVATVTNRTNAADQGEISLTFPGNLELKENHDTGFNNARKISRIKRIARLPFTLRRHGVLLDCHHKRIHHQSGYRFRFRSRPGPSSTSASQGL